MAIKPVIGPVWHVHFICGAIGGFLFGFLLGLKTAHHWITGLVLAVYCGVAMALGRRFGGVLSWLLTFLLIAAIVWIKLGGYWAFRTQG